MTEQKKPSALGGCLVLIVLAAIIMLTMSMCLGGGSATTYSSSGKLAGVVNPGTVAFTGEVTNTGDKEGKPNCFVRVNDIGNSYKGSDLFVPEEPLKPGQRIPLRGVVTVENNGAAFVTQIEVDCK